MCQFSLFLTTDKWLHLSNVSTCCDSKRKQIASYPLKCYMQLPPRTRRPTRRRRSWWHHQVYNWLFLVNSFPRRYSKHPESQNQRLRYPIRFSSQTSRLLSGWTTLQNKNVSVAVAKGTIKICVRLWAFLPSDHGAKGWWVGSSVAQHPNISTIQELQSLEMNLIIKLVPDGC